MSIYFQNNLKALVSNFPELVEKIYEPHKEYCLFLARSGHYTARLNRGNKLLHSLIDPLRETERFVAEQEIQREEKIILFGFGLGYHAREILRQARNLRSLIIVELNKEIMKAALEASDISDIINDPRVELLLPETDNSFLQLLQAHFADIHTNVKVILHTPSVQSYRERFPISYSILEMFKVRRLNSRRNLQLLQDNFYANMELVKSDPGARELFGRYRELPVLLVGAGPSLDENLDRLRRMREHSLVIAVNSVARRLSRAGVRPDFVVVMDPSEKILADVPGARFRQVPLIYLVTANPGYVEQYPGPRYAVYAENGPQEEEFMKAYPRGVLQSGFGTVLGSALDLAVKMGSELIYLFGADLAYHEHKRYSAGVSREQEHLATELFDVEKLVGPQGIKLFTTPGLRFSRNNIETYIQEARARNPRLRIVNMSTGGVPIRGTEPGHREFV